MMMQEAIERDTETPTETQPKQLDPQGPKHQEPSRVKTPEAEKPTVTFFEPPLIPTLRDSLGISFDFNNGVRVCVPADAEGEWLVEFRDVENDHVVFRRAVEPGSTWSSKIRYYRPWELKVWRDGKLVLEQTMKLEGKPVLVQYPNGLSTLGDFLGWLPYVDRFQRQHNCELTLALPQVFIDLVQAVYPNLTMLPHDKVDTSAFYASYRLGLFFGDKDFTLQPCDFRFVGLHRTAGYILGVDTTEEPAKLHLPDDSRPIAEKYVVIATKASTQCKYWNHLSGWRETIRFLKDHGYRVVCIDKEPVHGTGRVFNHIPHGCEDETGDKPLSERARWIMHADAFIGLSSGLSWLAWAVNGINKARPDGREVPIVMISGFTHPTNEFHTPYRVINLNTCHSCWNDPAHSFDHKDFLWCPRHAGTDREFECTRKISPDQVKQAIRRIPGFPSESSGSIA